MKKLLQRLEWFYQRLGRIFWSPEDKLMGWLIFGIGIASIVPAIINSKTANFYAGSKYNNAVPSYMETSLYYIALSFLGLIKSRYTLFLSLWSFPDYPREVIPVIYEFFCGASERLSFGPNKVFGPLFPSIAKYCPPPSHVPYMVYSGKDSISSVPNGTFFLHTFIGQWSLMEVSAELILIILTIAAIIRWLTIGVSWIKQRAETKRKGA